MSKIASVNEAVCKLCPPLRNPRALRQTIRIMYFRGSRCLACSLFFVLFVSVVWVTGKNCPRAQDKPRSLLSILEHQILRCVELTRVINVRSNPEKSLTQSNDVSAAYALRSVSPADASEGPARASPTHAHPGQVADTRKSGWSIHRSSSLPPRHGRERRGAAAVSPAPRNKGFHRLH